MPNALRRSGRKALRIPRDARRLDANIHARAVSGKDNPYVELREDNFSEPLIVRQKVSLFESIRGKLRRREASR